MKPLLQCILKLSIFLYPFNISWQRILKLSCRHCLWFTSNHHFEDDPLQVFQKLRLEDGGFQSVSSVYKYCCCCRVAHACRLGDTLIRHCGMFKTFKENPDVHKHIKHKCKTGWNLTVKLVILFENILQVNCTKVVSSYENVHDNE